MNGFQKNNKLGKLNKGKSFTQEHKDKIRHALLGHKHTEETKKKLSEYKKGKPNLSRLGKKHSLETKIKISLANLGKRNSPKTEFKKGIKMVKLKRHEKQYKIWRISVLTRDNWTCQNCGIRGLVLEVHHIKSYALYPMLRYDASNGVTLCKQCHCLVDRNRKRFINNNEAAV